MMSKFLKVQYTIGSRLLIDYIAVEMCNISKATYFSTLYDDNPALWLYRAGALHEDADEYKGDAMHALLRWLDANSETLPGDRAAAENAEDANVRRHFLALVGYCEDWADVCTDDRKFSIYMTMLKILVHSGELPTEVPAAEMNRRLDTVCDVCNAGLDDKTAMPHIRDIYQNIMNLADIGAELPEDAS